MLEIKKLSKSYNNKTVLNNISLTVNSGEIALLLGSSGVGKSTLLRILNNLETYDSGTLVLDGKPLNVKDVNKNHKVGMVFQQFNLFEHMTVKRNITFPLVHASKINIKHANLIAVDLLKKYGLEDKANLYINQLSGGQKQRLAIARTLALKPRVICMDEPTSALDPLLTNYVSQNIAQLSKENYIVLVASHNTALIEKLNCTIYLMENGEIVETANSQEFNANIDKYPKIKHFMAGHHQA